MGCAKQRSPFALLLSSKKTVRTMYMNRKFTLIALIALTIFISYSFDNGTHTDRYQNEYNNKLNRLRESHTELLATIQSSDIHKEADVEKILSAISHARTQLKAVDFWTRYMEPVAYRLMNGPLPVEWETEVFEKFEAPYKRAGTGLTQAALYLEEDLATKEYLTYLVQSSLAAIDIYQADSITNRMTTHDHFYLCNRLFLLNLAAIYTTGFECPDTSLIIPELQGMMKDVNGIYNAFNESYSKTPLPETYISLYNQAVDFVQSQPDNYSEFDHFTFIKDYVNPLFIQNQQSINKYKVFSKSFVDYTLNKKEVSIFNKEVYHGQNPKGIFLRVDDPEVLQDIDAVGKLLFFDPILSGNNQRSCASCHKPDQFFTDTLTATSIQFNGKDFLPRNTPSLINAQYNHLLMLDGKHISLQNQAKDVMSNPKEMACKQEDIVAKVLSCNEYNKAFKKLLKYTPTEKEVTLDHITSALTYYYSKFSNYYSPFDRAINENAVIANDVKQGFNLFMSKSQCATCHFAPQFNGVKPPYVGSEFEVLGVPEDTAYSTLSDDAGRNGVHKADEMKNAFRTGTIRNAAHTAPYMHNGVFRTLDEVVDFYNAGGGAGHGLSVANQTLSADSLGLSATEKKKLISFMTSLNEDVVKETPPKALPSSKNKALNTRKVGGIY